ncbi:MAG: hypothetical protein ACD_72C00328G0001 [uncultured bacterium]|nr:MAG: hypothetical protein ACD_72C00328G0001 [uncultured bacterium]
MAQLENHTPDKSIIPESAVNRMMDKAALTEEASIKIGDQEGYQIFETTEVYKGEEINLHILYNPFSVEQPVFEDFSFVYTVGDDMIAVVVFSKNDGHCYVSEHRFVDTARPNTNGLGTILLQHAEQFFLLLARREKHPLKLQMPLAQAPVMKWARRNGYKEAPDQEVLVDSIISEYDSGTNSGRFVFRDNQTTINGQAQLRRGYVFTRSQTQADIFSAVRIDFEKIIGQRAR